MLNNKKVDEKNLDQPAIPCGLIAKSFFNDTFELFKCHEDDCDTKPELRIKIAIAQNDIAWTSDVQDKFKNIVSPPKSSDGTAQTYMDI